MCKVMAFTNLTKVKNIQKLVNTVVRALEGEDDGFGYSIQTANGVYGERSLNPLTFKYSMKREQMKFPFLIDEYNRFGVLAPPSGGGIFHTRTSTNDRTLINTHPINKHGWSLIHNGVVTDHGPKYEMATTNDTEHVLERLVSGGINAVAEHLSGYYGVAALDPMGKLHVFRDDRAPLYFAEVKDIDSYIIATTDEAIEEVAKVMKWTLPVIQLLADNHYLIFEGNNIINQEVFTPRGSTWNEDRLADLSLGETVKPDAGNKWTESVETYRPYREMETRWHDSGLSEDEILFLEEIETTMDSTYHVIDYRGNPIDVEDFFQMNPEEMLCCTVIRPDGTLCDQMDYHTDKLYNGKVG